MIYVHNVSKMYRIYNRRSDRLREWGAGFFGVSIKRHQEFWALRNVNLQVPAGGVYGLIGMNGAGKSTLLKILTGTSQPTSGSVEVTGRVAALLELGTGFHGEFTGRENIQINGKLLGLTGAEITERIAEIKAFSELGDFFEKPVRTYSSGMYVRLAFSLASSISPNVLIIDEALSVGDAYFQQKCLARIRKFKEEGVTILFVSHDALAIKLLCDEVALLDQGQVIERGDPQELLEMYNALLARKDGQGRDYAIARGQRDAVTLKETLVSGNMKAVIKKLEIFDAASGKKVEALQVGQKAVFALSVEMNERIANPTFGLLVRDRLGYDVFGTNTADMGVDTGVYEPGREHKVRFQMQINLGPGAYTVTAAIHSSHTHVDDCYQWIDRLLTFNVLPDPTKKFLGVAYLDPHVTLE